MQTPLQAKDTSNIWSLPINSPIHKKQQNEELIDFKTMEQITSDFEEFNDIEEVERLLRPLRYEIRPKISKRSISDPTLEQLRADFVLEESNNENLGVEQAGLSNQNNIQEARPTNMTEMWLKMAKQVPDMSVRDAPDNLYEAVGKLRRYGALVPETQWELFLRQILGKMDNEMSKYVEKERNLTNSEKLAEFLEEKFINK